MIRARANEEKHMSKQSENLGDIFYSDRPQNQMRVLENRLPFAAQERGPDTPA